MSKFTPGPWVESKAKWGDCSWGCRDGEADFVGDPLPIIAVLPEKKNRDFDIYICPRREDQQDREIPDGERWSNARLIAAAPEMLELLKQIADWPFPFLSGAGIDEVRELAGKMVKKVEGAE